MSEDKKIDEIDEKLDKTEDYEIIINLLYQKVDLLEEIIGKLKNQNKLASKEHKEKFNEFEAEIEKKGKIINNAITEIETLRTYFSEDLQPDFIRILEILKDKKL